MNNNEFFIKLHSFYYQYKNKGYNINNKRNKQTTSIFPRRSNNCCLVSRVKRKIETENGLILRHEQSQSIEF